MRLIVSIFALMCATVAYAETTDEPAKELKVVPPGWENASTINPDTGEAVTLIRLLTLSPDGDKGTFSVSQINVECFQDNPTLFFSTSVNEKFKLSQNPMVIVQIDDQKSHVLSNSMNLTKVDSPFVVAVGENDMLEQFRDAKHVHVRFVNETSGEQRDAHFDPSGFGEIFDSVIVPVCGADKE